MFFCIFLFKKENAPLLENAIFSRKGISNARLATLEPFLLHFYCRQKGPLGGGEERKREELKWVTLHGGWVAWVGLLLFKKNCGSSCKISRKNSKKGFFFCPISSVSVFLFPLPLHSESLSSPFLFFACCFGDEWESKSGRVEFGPGRRGSFFWRLDTKVEETLFKRERKEERERKRERERVGGTPLHSMKVYKNPRNCHIFSFGNRVKRAKMAIGESPPHSPIPS